MGGSLNQPSSVRDEGPMGCKPLLLGNNGGHVWPRGMYPSNKHRLIPCQQPR